MVPEGANLSRVFETSKLLISQSTESLKSPAGQFNWSGADYQGEAYTWPHIGSSSGLLDRTDYPHATGLERQSWSSPKPMVRIVRRVAPTAAGPIDPGEATDPRPMASSLRARLASRNCDKRRKECCGR